MTVQGKNFHTIYQLPLNTFPKDIFWVDIVAYFYLEVVGALRDFHKEIFGILLVFILLLGIIKLEFHGSKLLKANLTFTQTCYAISLMFS